MTYHTVSRADSSTSRRCSLFEFAVERGVDPTALFTLPACPLPVRQPKRVHKVNKRHLTATRSIRRVHRHDL